MDRIQNDCNINPFLLATSDNQKAKNEFSSNWSRPVFIQIEGDSSIPYLNLKSILENNDDEVVIAPFTKVVNIEEISDNSEKPTSYKIILENQELTSFSEEESKELLDNILKNADIANQKLNTCRELDSESIVHYENIRKLEQLLAKHNFVMEQENYENDTTEEEKQGDLDDIARINSELTSLKDSVTKLFNARQENVIFMSDWKNNVSKYLMSEWQKTVLKYAKNETTEPENLAPTEENSENLEDELTFEASGDPIIDSVKSEAKENIAMVKTLLNNIKNLISKQQNHARIAEATDSNYKALNNAFEMRNFAEELDALVKSIYRKIDTLSSKNDKELLDKISKTSIQISTLINYLNNPKNAVSKKITRFDEINIIEENELKKGIAETIKNIRCEAELKKLNDDIDIIEDKSNIKKFFDKFTGRNKLDETMLDQIEVRQTAIRKTFRNRMPLAYNYSIHELIAEIEMFIKENEDDELVIEDVNALRKIEDTLKKNFVIIDSKVASIMNQKTGRNLPVASKKVSKQELIEIDTYRFLNRYGYDKTRDNNEPEYQDTIANEIKRIVDYIKSSGVL